MKLFAASICAQIQKTETFGISTVTISAARAIKAANMDEAIGIALKEARKSWPPEKNYYSHEVSLFEIPSAWILEAAKSLSV